jgi:hypothetical protein
MISHAQYILQRVTRWLVVGLAVIAAIVLLGLLQQKNMWGMDNRLLVCSHGKERTRPVQTIGGTP